MDIDTSLLGLSTRTGSSHEEEVNEDGDGLESSEGNELRSRAVSSLRRSEHRDSGRSECRTSRRSEGRASRSTGLDKGWTKHRLIRKRRVVSASPVGLQYPVSSWSRARGAMGRITIWFYYRRSVDMVQIELV